MKQSTQRNCLYVLHALVTLFYVAIPIFFGLFILAFCDNCTANDIKQIEIELAGLVLVIIVIIVTISVFAFRALRSSSTAGRLYLYFWSVLAILLAVLTIFSLFVPLVLLVAGIWTIYYAHKYVRESGTTKLETLDIPSNSPTDVIS
jgi:TRAP-type C4-dicarboxylate transport system permease small subunit